jgi:large subunit ribosomal protein L10
LVFRRFEVLRSQKQEFVVELEGVCRSSESVVFTHYHGLTVAQITELRRSLRSQNAEFKVVKNTLFKIAANNAKVQLANDMAKGPIAIAYSADPVAAAKVIVEFAKTNDNLKVIGGIVSSQLLSTDEIVKLSKLPSLNELRGKIIGILQASAGKLVSVVQAPAAQLARVVNAYATKK